MINFATFHWIVPISSNCTEDFHEEAELITFKHKIKLFAVTYGFGSAIVALQNTSLLTAW